jgi:hypothetical protein
VVIVRVMIATIMKLPAVVKRMSVNIATVVVQKPADSRLTTSRVRHPTRLPLLPRLPGGAIVQRQLLHQREEH